MLIESLFSHAAKIPTQVAVHDERGQYTYQQLADMAAGLAAHISHQTQAQNVGLLLPAGAGFVGSFYGTLAAGKSAVLINYLLGDKEIAHIIADSGIDTIITIPQLAGRLGAAKLKIIDLTQLPQRLPEAITPTITPTIASNQITQRQPDDLAVLIYTSGTSGLPKGVMLTFANLQTCIDAAIQHAGINNQHRFLGTVPPFHSLGLTATVLAPIYLASPVVYLARFSAVAVMNAIRQHNISLLFMVPSMYGALLHLKNASADDFKNMYATISGGEPLPEMIRENFTKRFGIPLLEGYGLTETCGPITINVPKSFRPGSVGQFVPGAGAKFVDDYDREVPAGQTGEIWLRGPMIMKGYYNMPEVTAATITADRHFKTGDLGRIDEDGFLYITGRKKEMIIVAGEKVSPREIEDVLTRHATVQEAAVIGKKDVSRGEVVVAFVIAREGQTIAVDVLRDFCREQGLAQWKIPREFHVVTDLPRSPTGKVLKRVLAEKLTV